MPLAVKKSVVHVVNVKSRLRRSGKKIIRMTAVLTVGVLVSAGGLIAAPALAFADDQSRSEAQFLAGTLVSGIDRAVSIDRAVLSDTTMTDTNPLHAPGTVDIAEQHPNGENTVVPLAYRAETPNDSELNNSMIEITPSSGPSAGGTFVTVTGTGFLTAMGVYFDGEPGTELTVLSDTELTIASPPHAEGSIPVIVVGEGDAASFPANYTYLDGVEHPPTPVITDMTPREGPTSGSTTVTIRGTGFSSVRSVTFGDVEGDGAGVPAPASFGLFVAAAAVTPGSNMGSFTIVSDTELSVITPPQTIGPVNVVLVALGGTVSAGVFTYVAGPDTGSEWAPAIADISPAQGTVDGGTVITLTGTNFLGATDVMFGDQPVAAEVVDDTTIRATSPAFVPGAVDVIVVSPPGNSNAVQFTYFSGNPDGGTAGGGGEETPVIGAPDDDPDPTKVPVGGVDGGADGEVIRETPGNALAASGWLTDSVPLTAVLALGLIVTGVLVRRMQRDSAR